MSNVKNIEKEICECGHTKGDHMDNGKLTKVCEAIWLDREGNEHNCPCKKFKKNGGKE